MTYTLISDYYEPWRRLLAKKGETVILVSDHQGSLIVENSKGDRFAINKAKVIPSANTDGSLIKGG